MKFHTQLKAKDILKFSLAYTYSGVQAILTIFMLGVGAYMIVHGIGQPEGQTNIIFGVVVIALFVVINPLMIYVKAKKQAIENPVYKNPTYYTLRDDGIFVELGEESATIEWNRVYKITHFMGLTLLYTGKQQAFVFPDYEARKKAVQTQTDGGDISKYSKASAETEREETEVSESEVQENSEGEE